jgi:hypothetical protein
MNLQAEQEQALLKSPVLAEAKQKTLIPILNLKPDLFNTNNYIYFFCQNFNNISFI